MQSVICFTIKWVLFGVALRVLASDVTSGHDAREFGYQVDCTTIGYRWEPHFGDAIEVENVGDCRSMCANTSDCKHFSFDHEQERTCFLSDASADPRNRNGFISGPSQVCECPSRSVGDSLFPLNTATASMDAFPTGAQPFELECWPKTSEGGFYPCATTILDDTNDREHPWPGGCLNLRQVQLEIGESCEQSCSLNPFCPAWQTTDVDGPQGEGCWQGVGDHCNTRAGRDWQPTAAQRLQHGDVQVISRAVTYQLLGLRNVFDANYFEADFQAAVEACKRTCYSDILCQYWQFLRGSGCWIEDPRHGRVAQYPLVLDENAQLTSLQQTDVVDGEFIQHYCTMPHRTDVIAERPVISDTEHANNDDSGFSRPTSPENYVRDADDTQDRSFGMVFLGILAGLLIVAGVGISFLHRREKKSSSRSRNRRADENQSKVATSNEIATVRISQAVPTAALLQGANIYVPVSSSPTPSTYSVASAMR